MEFVLVIYLAVGLLLALLMSRRESAEGWDARHWAYAVTMWPHYVGATLPAIFRLGLASLTRAEVRFLTWIVRAAVRRLEAHGCIVTMERKTDGKE